MQLGSFFSRRRALLIGAIVFAVATTLYSAVWMYYIRQEPKAQLGVDLDYRDSFIEINQVTPGTAADRAGLKRGDRIVAVNGRGLNTPTGFRKLMSSEGLTAFHDAVVRGRPGDLVLLTIERGGSPARLTLEAILDAPLRADPRPWPAVIAGQFLRSYPILFLFVGLPVLFLRLDNLNAWLLAFVFAGFISAAPLVFLIGGIHPSLRGFMLAYMVLFYGLFPPIFYYFFATFPSQSPIDRRLPWLKFALLLPTAAVVLPLAAWLWWAGNPQPLYLAGMWVKQWQPLAWIVVALVYATMALALVSLIWNSVSAPTREARRKTRVILWGTVAGFSPFLLLGVLAESRRTEVYQFPFWVWAPAVLATFLVPLSIAYAVVKHRVLEIPVLLKRSARYLLVQRGFVLLLLVAEIILIFAMADYVSRHFPERAKLALPLGALVGVTMLWGGTRVHTRVRQRIDRAFFRSAYDARQILDDLVTRARTAKTENELAMLLERHLLQALHPSTLAIYAHVREGRLRAQRFIGAPAPEVLDVDVPQFAEIAQRGEVWEVPPEGNGLGTLQPLRPECLVPVVDRQSRLRGLIVLGSRLSEEPYSREDRRLLASIAAQAGVALENIHLAEDIAERLEAERRAAHEMEIAREVQRKLFPQKWPSLSSLDYAGTCVQARTVGGDYYDFLDLGEGRLGIVVADIAGKGISAALLMANLQANLRSQYALAVRDLPGLLQSVNHLFYENTEQSHYATFFIGIYDDATRKLQYANCGHNPPLLLRAEGLVERLAATATVLGLFEQWDCAVDTVELVPGDLLTVYTDGITDATSPDGKEFGEQSLLEELQQNRSRSATDLLQAVVTCVQEHSSGIQFDDLTLVIGRAR